MTGPFQMLIIILMLQKHHTGYKQLKHDHLGHSTIGYHLSYSLSHYKVTVNRKTLKLTACLFFTLKCKTVKLERQTTLYVVIQQQNFTVNVAICPHCLAVSLGPALSLSSACGQSLPRFICAILWQRRLLQRLYSSRPDWRRQQVRAR